MPDPTTKPFYHLLEGREGRLRSMRLWSKVEMCGHDECWNWQASRTSSGYGRFKIASRFTLSASRVVWALVNGRDPGEMFVLHSCDNPPCCNPAHLRLGTVQDNSDDKVARGRCRTGDQTGSSNGAAKIDEKVLELIVTRLKAGWPNTVIARDLPVSDSLVSRIRCGQSWRAQAAALGWDRSPLIDRKAA